jgi:hypothetical protein
MNEPARRGTEAYELWAGDQITVGVTHQVEIGRDKSWVKYEAITKVRPGEEAQDARTRAVGHVNESVMVAVAKTVEQIRSQ